MSKRSRRRARQKAKVRSDGDDTTPVPAVCPSAAVWDIKRTIARSLGSDRLTSSMASITAMLRCLKSTAAQAHQGMHLFGLPQEIQDMIFDLAYPLAEGAVYRTKLNWQTVEKKRRLDPATTAADYKPRPFPAPKVNAFLVSKHFFLAAAKAWVRNQDIYCTTHRLNSAFKYLSTNHAHGIVRAFSTKLRCKFPEYRWRCIEMPNLRELTLLVDPTSMTSKSDKIAWLDVMDADDFRKLISEEASMSRTRLRKFEVAPYHGPESARAPGVARIQYPIRTLTEESLFISNLKAFETFMRPLVMDSQEKGRVNEVGRWRKKLLNVCPLYPGSKVRTGSAWAQIIDAAFDTVALGYFRWLVLAVFICTVTSLVVGFALCSGILTIARSG